MEINEKKFCRFLRPCQFFIDILNIKKRLDKPGKKKPEFDYSFSTSMGLQVKISIEFMEKNNSMEFVSTFIFWSWIARMIYAV